MSAIVEEQVDSVRTLTLNRPEVLNAMTAATATELGQRLEAAAADSSVRAVVLTGAGAAFSAGGDHELLEELVTMPSAQAKDVVYGSFQRPVRAIRAMEKPVIAAVNGPAVGAGCEVVIASDFRIASERARFGEVWIKLGCVPALGGMFLLPRIVGLTRAVEMILTGEIIDAAEAYRIGLVSRVVAAEALLPAAMELARSLARGPTRALAAAKVAINRGLSSSFWAELESTLPSQLLCFKTKDYAEGVRALIERRPPQFSGQ